MGYDLSEVPAMLPLPLVPCCRPTSSPPSAPGGSCLISQSPHRLEASSLLRNLATPDQQLHRSCAPCLPAPLEVSNLCQSGCWALGGTVNCMCSVQVRAGRNHGGWESRVKRQRKSREVITAQWKS